MKNAWLCWEADPDVWSYWAEGCWIGSPEPPAGPCRVAGAVVGVLSAGGGARTQGSFTLLKTLSQPPPELCRGLTPARPTPCLGFITI